MNARLLWYFSYAQIAYWPTNTFTNKIKYFNVQFETTTNNHYYTQFGNLFWKILAYLQPIDSTRWTKRSWGILCHASTTCSNRLSKRLLSFWPTILLTSFHKISIKVWSVLHEGQIGTVTAYWCSQAFTVRSVCFGSLSCWNFQTTGKFFSA